MVPIYAIKKAVIFENGFYTFFSGEVHTQINASNHGIQMNEFFNTKYLLKNLILLKVKITC